MFTCVFVHMYVKYLIMEREICCYINKYKMFCGITSIQWNQFTIPIK